MDEMNRRTDKTTPAPNHGEHTEDQDFIGIEFKINIVYVPWVRFKEKFHTAVLAGHGQRATLLHPYLLFPISGRYP